MKKHVTLGDAYLFSKVHICGAKIPYVDDIDNSHFSEAMPFNKIIKTVDG